MTNAFRPMLAESKIPNDKQLEAQLKKGPMYSSIKLDGIRNLVKDGTPVTRSLTLLPNIHVRRTLQGPLLNGFDGELTCGPANAKDVFNRSQSAFMSQGGTPDWTYHVFDDFSCSGNFEQRLRSLQSRLHANEGRFVLVKQTLVRTLEDVRREADLAYGQGYEGLILKDPRGPYKYGRSTMKQGWMLKIKQWEDSEAEIIDFEELLINENAALKDDMGLQYRTSHKAGMKPGNTLGVVKVRDIHHGWEFGIGSGFDDAMRDKIWKAQDKFKGKIVTYKFSRYGMKDVPRQPIFKGFRHAQDIG
jgi:DNA ligase-1